MSEKGPLRWSKPAIVLEPYTPVLCFRQDAYLAPRSTEIRMLADIHRLRERADRLFPNLTLGLDGWAGGTSGRRLHSTHTSIESQICLTRSMSYVLT